MSRVPTGAELLDRVLPFAYLPLARRRALEGRLELRTYRDGEMILRRGETSRDLHLLAEGRVDVLDEHGERVTTIDPGHYFGERAALFDKPRRMGCVARGPTTTYALPGRELLQLVDEEPVFAQALSAILRVKQGVFLPYRRLFARLLTLIDKREFLLSELLPAYRELAPALHPLIAEPVVDVGALGYALPRLPAEVTTTHFHYLTGILPALYRDADRLFPAVPTKTRRRNAWRIAPGKLLTIMRDGVSDVTDFLTCLSVYAVEGKKLRRRLRSPETLDALTGLAAAPDPAREEALLLAAAFSPEEVAGLRRIFGAQLAARLREIILHHEDIGIECDTEFDNYNSRATELWVHQIRARVRELVDVEDPELEVHIISSNTHGVANCLSPRLGRSGADVLAWGRANRAALCGDPTTERAWGGTWACREDLLYVLARDWFAQHPEQRRQADEEALAAGHHRLTATAYTGIEVDLFDLRRIEPALCDPGIRARRAARPTILVNVDFAFGQQAEEILSTLLLLFGKRVRSVNVLGKAGGLVGDRGDLLLPTATLLQTNDELYPLPNHDLPAGLLRELAPGIPVHEGPVLTVAGTLLQDRVLLWFYRRIWKCVGLEMEGSFFARNLISAIETGVVRPDVRSRFCYYTSDIPLRAGESLSEAMHATEGVPPLYAITRAFLRKIFEDVGRPGPGAAR